MVSRELSCLPFSSLSIHLISNTSLCHLQKLSDDSSISGCIHNESVSEYRRLVEDFDLLFWEKLFKLSSCSIKELVVNFLLHREPEHITPIFASLHWLPVHYRAQLKVLMFVF